MGERKGQNKYYPPDFDPKKHKSLDAYHGTHALRERASKIHLGILVIRFEMPYNIWCDGCNNPIGMGVRYNAEKKKIGMYYSTPVWNFHMKCHLCDQYFDIKTDPASHDYVITSGARRKEQRWDPKENEQIVTEDKDEVKKRTLDAMYKMEHGVEDRDKGKKAQSSISHLTSIKKQWKDDYELNKLVRSQFRDRKKLLKSEIDKDQALLSKASLDIELVPETTEDKRLAELLQYRTAVSYDERQKQKREEINNRSIFHTADSPVSTPSSSSTSSDNSSPALKTLGKIIGKRTSPFCIENTAKSLKSSLNPTDLGIRRKQNASRDGQRLSESVMDDSDKNLIGSRENDSGSFEEGVEHLQEFSGRSEDTTPNALTSLMAYSSSSSDGE